MAKISDTGSYPQATVTGDDYLIGTDSADSNKTKTFTVDSLSTYILGGSGAAYVVPVYVSGTQFGNSIISQDAAVGTAITIAGALTVNLTLTAPGDVNIGTGPGISTVSIGLLDTDALNIEATTKLNGPIRDASGALGTLGQTLVSNASGLVFWT